MIEIFFPPVKKADNYFYNIIGSIVSLFNLPRIILFPPVEKSQEISKAIQQFSTAGALLLYVVWLIIGFGILFPWTILILIFCAVFGYQLNIQDENPDLDA